MRGIIAGEQTAHGGFDREILARGFTLIEMMVVVFIMGIVFFFAVPRLQEGPFSDPKGKTYRWLSAEIRDLRRKAEASGRPWRLNIDLDNQAFWSEPVDLQPEGISGTSGNRFKLPGGLVLSEVEIGTGKGARAGVTAIRFKSQGVSDMAVLRFRTQGMEIWSMFIEPFLSRVTLFDRPLTLAEAADQARRSGR